MSLALLAPLGLLALAAWLVPLLVHLARRHRYAPLDFAALRWLQARVRPRQRVRIDEWPLLLLRLLLLAVLALLLARPVLHGAAPDARPVVVVAPGLDGAALRGLDRTADWRWLAPGFPPLDEPAPVSTQPLASLLRELDQSLPAATPLTVHVPDPMPGLDGQPLRLSRAVDWRPVARAAGQLPDDAAGAPQLLRGGEEDDADTPASTLRVLGAVQQAWTGEPLPPALPAGTTPDAGQIGVWLADTALSSSWQDWLERGGTVLLVAPTPGPGLEITAAAGPGSTPTASPVAAPAPRSAPEPEPHPPWSTALRDANGEDVLQQRAVGAGRLLRFHAPLSPAQWPALRDPGFPRQLLAAVRPGPPPALATAATQAPLTGAHSPLPQPLDPAPWLLALAVLLFAIERWLATSPRRGARA
ncbi:hypothetical protein N792_11570 [Lysobacter concretionis Ko07 = DSM 16239]|uniref:Aerotolerance regulator N-terminal domain-containing protein n=1 Tax=Lysobacter concretionis Ko07 = DSM 16239 TaxID=1122185 RepID=A0A0A0EM15_9GAMM|nr:MULTISPECIES: BatA domain-containing protein [Lysobacter]KGM51369.1 hypothetical protein N792_11570 [Lysobacter concretionis Ko07 = DSM 16239]QOD91074.1 BatA domain-containing protein [Lysobacter sp. CW239]